MSPGHPTRHKKLFAPTTMTGGETAPPGMNMIRDLIEGPRDRYRSAKGLLAATDDAQRRPLADHVGVAAGVVAPGL
jgi:hypothetical protein